MPGLSKAYSRRELYKARIDSRAQLRLEASKLNNDGVREVLAQLRKEAEEEAEKSGLTREEHVAHASAAVRAWADEVNAAFQRDLPEKIEKLGELLQKLEQKGEKIETEMQQNLVDIEVLEMGFDALDIAFARFEADDEINPAVVEAIKREAERLKTRHEEVHLERTRIAREKAKFEHEMSELKEKMSTFGISFRKMCAMNPVQKDVVSDDPTVL